MSNYNNNNIDHKYIPWISGRFREPSLIVLLLLCCSAVTTDTVGRVYDLPLLALKKQAATQSTMIMIRSINMLLPATVTT